MHVVIVGFGQVALYKYLDLICEAIADGKVRSYSLLDLDSQKSRVESQLQGLSIAPAEIFYIPDRSSEGIWASEGDFAPILEMLHHRYDKIKVIITSEVKAHESYLRYCIENDLDSLVEKPVLLPMENGKFVADGLAAKMEEIVSAAKVSPAQHSVMSLGRYHQFFEDDIRAPLKQIMDQYNAPITSFHLRTNSGVWNMPDEYLWREDHPYKYGYGMLMHGAYHYVDILATFLEMNRDVYPDRNFDLSLSSFVATPFDQSIRVRENLYDGFSGDRKETSEDASTLQGLGETDIVTTFRMSDVESSQTLTIGTLCLEQTTPSMRCWNDIPEAVYNKNGRLSFTEIEAQISTIFSVNGRLLKAPKPLIEGEIIPSAYSYAETITRANSAIVQNHDYLKMYKREKFTKTSKNELIRAWINGDEQKSSLDSHLPSMVILEGLAKSLSMQGESVSVRLF